MGCRFFMRRHLSGNTYMHQFDDKTVIQTVADVSPVMERNLALRNVRTNFNPGDDHTLVMSIPMALVAQFVMERGCSIHEVMNDDGLLAQLAAAHPHVKTIDKSVF
jgi:hypothetical protein